MYILVAILIFGFLVAIHELGHFMAAKAFGVRVNEFSIGMGPAIFQKKKGDTDYSLRILPIGGYCAMEGESEEEASTDPAALSNQGLFPKFIIFAAGAFMNFLAGFLILIALCGIHEYFIAPVITDFYEGFPAQGEEMLQPGDRIIKIDGERILLQEDIAIFLNMGNHESYDFVVERDGERVVLNDLPLAPKAYPNPDGTSTVRFGLRLGEKIEATPLVQLKMAALNSYDFVRMVWYSLKMLITGQVGISDMSGPVGIVTTISDVGEQSASAFIALANIGYLTALIAINLAVMNLLPLPALDGGHIFIMFATAIITKVTGKKVDPKYAGYINYFGFVVLMGFMLIVTFSDIVKLFG